MKKCILIPDSFKGTMSSTEICRIMGEEIARVYPDCEILPVPVADGGEGSVDAFLTAVGGRKETLTVKGPFFEEIEAFYGILSDEKTAVIEMAAVAGLPLVEGHPDPEKTTTYGVGQLMRDAVEKGCTKLILGLGGSATNDAGCGAAAALGVVFRKADGSEFIPVGGTLGEICDVEIPKEFLSGVEIVTMCDIDNPLYGENGAAYVFAPQKGADPAAVKRLDTGLEHFAETVERIFGIRLQDIPGAGAAGGMGGGAFALFGSELKMGIDVVLETVGFDALLDGADAVFSGEGRIDDQTLRGKVVAGVARHTKKAKVPLIAVVGDIGDHIEPLYETGVTAVVSINRVAKPYTEVRARARDDLRLTMDTVLKLTALHF